MKEASPTKEAGETTELRAQAKERVEEFDQASPFYGIHHLERVGEIMVTGLPTFNNTLSVN